MTFIRKDVSLVLSSLLLIAACSGGDTDSSAGFSPIESGSALPGSGSDSELVDGLDDVDPPASILDPSLQPNLDLPVFADATLDTEAQRLLEIIVQAARAAALGTNIAYVEGALDSEQQACLGGDGRIPVFNYDCADQDVDVPAFSFGVPVFGYALLEDSRCDSELLSAVNGEGSTLTCQVERADVRLESASWYVRYDATGTVFTVPTLTISPELLPEEAYSTGIEGVCELAFVDEFNTSASDFDGCQTAVRGLFEALSESN